MYIYIYIKKIKKKYNKLVFFIYNITCFQFNSKASFFILFKNRANKKIQERNKERIVYFLKNNIKKKERKHEKFISERFELAWVHPDDSY
jgi:hypothetical protein